MPTSPIHDLHRVFKSCRRVALKTLTGLTSRGEPMNVYCSRNSAMVVEGVTYNKCGGGRGTASIVVGKQAEFSRKTPKRITLMSLPTGGASKLRMP